MNSRVINHRTRQKVFERDGYTCINCGKTREFAQLEADHIIEVSEGGTNNLDNLQTLCYECNMDKHFGKMTTKDKELNNLEPKYKLNLLKNKIREYSELTWDELKVIYVLDPFFRKIRVPRDDIHGIYLQIIGKEEKRKRSRGNHIKFKEQRDLIIRKYKKLAKFSLRELEEDLKKSGFGISHVQLSYICNNNEQDTSICERI